MTAPAPEPTTLPTPAAEPPAQTTEQAPGGDPTSADQPERGGRYRQRLADAESERDSLRSRLDVHQRAEVLRLAAADLAVPEGIFARGPQLDDYLDENGAVDPAAVRDAALDLIESLGLAPKPATMKPDHSQGSRGAAPAPDHDWQALLSRKD